MENTTKQTSILIVEDDPFIAMDLEDTFDAHGFEVIGPYADVDSGLKGICERRPDCAMLDYNLGRETSIALARELQVQGIPYIFLSGQIENVVMAHDLPKRAVVAKPFVPDHLISVVENLIS